MKNEYFCRLGFSDIELTKTSTNLYQRIQDILNIKLRIKVVYVKKSKDSDDKGTGKSERKRTPIKKGTNPLKVVLTSEQNDKRKVRKDFFSKTPSDGKPRFDKKDNKEDKRTHSDRDYKNKEGRGSREKPNDGSRFKKNNDTSSRRSTNTENKPFRKAGSDSEKRPYRNSERAPYQRDNRDRSQNRGDDNNRSGSERRPYRDSERAPFQRDDRDRSQNRREEDNYFKKPRKRNAIAESAILSDIVDLRRSEGRGGERKPKILSLKWSEERGPIRLNKYIANAGICSRRDADKLIEAGAVKVNGIIVTELGTKVLPIDEVRYEDKILQREKPVYILLNKPKDYITTTEDEKDRNHVMMLIEDACSERVYPVGRLDRNTTGLLLFTNDGEMAKRLTHPRYGVRKIYHVELDRNLDLADFEKIAEGIELRDGLITPDDIAYVGDSKKEIGLTLHSGKNRIVRRIFEQLEYTIEKLDRVSYAGLTKKDLPRGHWRFLKQEEINILKMSTAVQS